MKTFVFIIVVLNIVLSISAIVLILLLDKETNKKLDKIDNLVDNKEDYVSKKDIINSSSFFMDLQGITKDDINIIIDILEKSQEDMDCNEVETLYKFYNKLYDDDYKNITFPRAILFEYLEDLFDVSYRCDVCDNDYDGLIYISYSDDKLPISLKPLTDLGGDPTVKLGECEGDCDADSDCIYGLKCFQRNGSEQVPGCINGGDGDIVGHDYCVGKFFLEERDPTTFSDDGKYFVLDLNSDPNDTNNIDRVSFTSPISVYHEDYSIEYRLTLDQYKQLIHAYMLDRIMKIETLYCGKSCSGISSIDCS